MRKHFRRFVNHLVTPFVVLCLVLITIGAASALVVTSFYWTAKILTGDM